MTVTEDAEGSEETQSVPPKRTPAESPLTAFLHTKHVGQVLVVGLATDYWYVLSAAAVATTKGSASPSFRELLWD
jgi:hypothetical protein